MTPNRGQLSVSLPPIEVVSEAYDAAAKENQVHERWFLIAEAVVQVRIVGAALLEPLTRALAHLVIEPRHDSDLIINCWDQETSRIGLPLPPIDRSLSEGTVTEVGDEGLIFWGSPALVSDSDEGWVLWRPAFNSFSAVTPDCTRAWHWVEAASEIPYWDVAAPFKAILHRWARGRGMQLLHAGSVGTADGAVLLVGSPGSGKSTTSLVCLDAGMQYLGDDYVMVSTEPEPRVHSISCAAKLEIPQVQRFPHLMPTIWNSDRLGQEREEKAVAFFDHSSRAVVDSLSLSMIVVPRIGGGESTTSSTLSAGEAFLALAPSTIIQMPGSGHDEFEAMGDLVRSVPSAAIQLGTDLASIPPVIANLLKQ